ncbi:MAG: nucleotidyl transferase AbiEii/AbiGii toxin family protein [Nitrososphaerota archaeon]|jgi:predicted nucleotidyltransferase component of viral defense system|nr:nucleotidyl transferase AbiEii/AbiGii toxin family protein [Nitrososphaerota archaeon]MDG7041250.1 nucleotidyl transferase AbiEii/AbiGii toxin family protein [Nitrososphaerota archaeon]MDG7043327.1 nucleotidyl transferase AbiEii/AbiGii toxin family protein [Nitrososphaerota archaeon]MDG7046344.1 nucleotidyl transferase AbiEii/AbiGii toxin family protein [Nitrososphaerota archaeon]
MDLYKKMRKRTQTELAYAQDIVVEKIYDYLPEVVLHGGTLIWRCYAGNRFSEDLDFYAASRLGIQGFSDDLKP